MLSFRQNSNKMLYYNLEATTALNVLTQEMSCTWMDKLEYKWTQNKKTANKILRRLLVENRKQKNLFFL